VFHHLFDHIEACAPRLKTLAEVRSLATLAEKVMAPHSKTEDDLFIEPLEHCFAQIGQSETFHHEHELIEQTFAKVQKVRDLATALRPAALDMGLVSAAEWLLAGFEERTGTRVHLRAPREDLGLDNERSTAAFRILQEALTNITRYAQASEVHVTIDLADQALVMVVMDDGIGFDPVEVRVRKTFGLLGIRERALMFGGESKVDSETGAGTVLRIRIPLRQPVSQ